MHLKWMALLTIALALEALQKVKLLNYNSNGNLFESSTIIQRFLNKYIYTYIL